MKDITDFISAIENETRRSDALKLLSMLSKLSGYTPYLNGSIICFGRYHYQYESGREGDVSVIAFSPRRQNLVLYIMPGFSELQTLLVDLGKHKVGKSCLYINKLADLDLYVLEKIMLSSIECMQNRYQCVDV